MDVTLADEAASHGTRAKHPAGWEPHVEEHAGTAVAVSQPLAGSPTHDELIRGWDMDPAEWMIVGDVQVRRWQRYDGEWLRYFRATLARRRAGVERADVDRLCRDAMRRKPNRPKPRLATHRALVVCLNDWQIGKGEGDGSEGIVRRVRNQIGALGSLVADLEPDVVALLNVGDLTERVSGHYASQPFTCDLDEREQQRVARRLLFHAVETVAPLVPSVLVTAVPCNHGENRGPVGKAQTRPSDNLSLSLTETVEEACQQNPDAYGHVRFQYAPDYVCVSELAGLTLASTHGHQFDRGGGDPMRKAEEWWRDQIMGTQHVAAADMLVTAHKHHCQVSERLFRPVVIAPANDGGSLWWTASTGQSSAPGMLTFGFGLGYGNPSRGDRCWGDLRVLSGEA